MSDVTVEPVNTVKVDKFDREDWLVTRSRIEPLADVEARLAEVSPTGADLVPDAFAACLKGLPQLADVPPRWAANRLVTEQLLGSDGLRDLREYTVGSALQSALGTITLADLLAETITKVNEQVKAEAEAAQAAQDRLTELLDQLAQAQEAGTPEDGPSDEDIDQAQAAADAAADALGTALAQAAPSVGRAVRQAAADAAAERGEEAEAMGGWDLNPGERSRMDPATYLAWAERLTNDRLRRIAERLGALRNLNIGARKRKFNLRPEEVYSIENGNDLARVLASEYAGLVLEDEYPELAELWYLRFAQRALLQFAMRGVEHVARGAIIYCEDGSGSMTGEPDIAAKATGLGLLDVAAADDRAFHAIHFGGVGEARCFDFPDRASVTLENRLAYAETFIASGGTDFQTPLDLALARLVAEHDATGVVGADIVFATDGQAMVTETWLAHFKAEQARLGFKVYGLLIGNPYGASSLDDICDGRVIDFTDLLSSRDIGDVFAAIQ